MATTYFCSAAPLQLLPASGPRFSCMEAPLGKHMLAVPSHSRALTVPRLAEVHCQIQMPGNSMSQQC